VLDVIEALFMAVFQGLATRYAPELAAIQGQYPFAPLQAKPLRLTFAGGAQPGGWGRGEKRLGGGWVVMHHKHHALHRSGAHVETNLQ
jgi:hypothetical protein